MAPPHAQLVKYRAVRTHLQVPEHGGQAGEPVEPVGSDRLSEALEGAIQPELVVLAGNRFRRVPTDVAHDDTAVLPDECRPVRAVIAAERARKQLERGRLGRLGLVWAGGVPAGSCHAHG